LPRGPPGRRTSYRRRRWFFTSDRDGDTEIYIRAGGRPPFASWTANTPMTFGAVWSPEGRKWLS
jgi:hypothetical protein